MTTDQLIFAVATHTEECRKLVAVIWKNHELVAKQVEKLNGHARLLHCAAVELDARAHGQPQPKVGHD